MVDIHCHVLPGVDDGARSWPIAVEMCGLAAAEGVTHVVATPHANDRFGYDRNECLELLEHLRELTGGVPALSLGCDFHFSYENVQALWIDRSPYLIGNTHYLLVELSDYAIPPNFADELLRLRQAGIQPVITHPERNPLVQQRPEQVLEWAEGGSAIQVTANALTGAWGGTARKMARWLLDHDAVHVIASDAHDTRQRPPLLSPARRLLAEWKSEELAKALVEDNPGAIIRDEPLPYFPHPVRPFRKGK